MFEVKNDLGADFGSFFGAPQLDQNYVQKWMSKAIHVLIVFGIDLLVDLGANLASTWAQLGNQDGPKSEQNLGLKNVRAAPRKRCGERY